MNNSNNNRRYAGLWIRMAALYLVAGVALGNYMGARFAPQLFLIPAGFLPRYGFNPRRPLSPFRAGVSPGRSAAGTR